MRGHKTILSNLVSYLVVIVLLLLTAGLADAQTQIGLVEKTRVEVKAAEPGSNVIDTKAAPTTSKAEPTRAEPVKSTAADATDGAKAQPKTLPQPLSPPAQCRRTINADVVALQQPIMLNRLGAAIPSGLVFALKSDTLSGPQLKPNKRPRPLVLRANVGDCLTINLTNLIPPDAFKITTNPPPNPVPPFNTSEISIHVQGMEWVTGSKDDGSFVGKNNSSLASVTPPVFPPGPNTQTYTLFARQEGTFLLYTMGDTSSVGDQLTRGLFGALNIEPAGAEWYRSQVTADELALATYNAGSLPAGATLSAGSCTTASPCTFTVTGKPPVKVIKTAGGFLNTLDNHPLINYNVSAAGVPILKMLDAGNNIVHSDLTALITGPNAGRFPGTTGVNTPEPPCNAEKNPALVGGPVDPLFCTNPAAPDRKQPYREFTIIYHGGLGPIATQAFPVFTDPNMSATLEAGQDAFAINYGTGGIGAEVYANRIGVGPMGECADCKFEEFFLSAWSVGDPAMLVDRPANANVRPPLSPSPATPPTAPGAKPCVNSDFDNPSLLPGTALCANRRLSVPPNDSYTIAPLAKATRAYYPDDPSNVYHSYINDHLKFRILHGGKDVTHVHHQHAHQWLQSPNSDEASYLDSQMISPGASYTLEMVYNGSGNRNKVVGDSIFHCHFYPHFAAGMWAMWRTHDVFESGSFVYSQGKMIGTNDVSGQVVPGSRALPDGEITAGTPNPAIVPLPTIPMAPLPAYAQIQNAVVVQGLQTATGGQVVIGGDCQSNKINGLDVIGGCANGAHLKGTVINSRFDGSQMTGQFHPSKQLENPGYPFFIPGIAGARAPHPPLDFAPDGQGSFMDGGLPRHLVAGGAIAYESHDKFDWSKDAATMNAVQLPELGTDVEQAAMAFHGRRCYATFFPDGTPGSCPSSNSVPPQSTLNNPPTGFLLNGLPRKNAGGNSAEKLGAQPGSPFADPGVDDNGQAVGTLRRYKAAAIQLNVTFNKKGWHFPQQRMLTLWQDAQPTIDFTNGKPGRKPEPLFFRGNSGDIIEYWHTNLVPSYYLVDDFQVRTPTDVLGQHIHLVKFDVTSSDGAGNGFNYEDGTFSPEEVQDTIKAINANGGLVVNGVKKLLLDPGDPQYKVLHGPPKDIFDCAANPNALRCQPCPPWTKDSRPECLSWLGAQTTIQRWYLDPLVDDSGVDRTLRTVFTHDHFGPSTHQQAGLYAGLVVEPKGATWTSNDGAATFGARSDGGPTSWEARIITNAVTDSYREFLLEFQDLQLAYSLESNDPNHHKPPIPKPSANPKRGYIDEAYAISPPSGQVDIAKPSLVTTGIPDISAGTQSVNYLNEPLALRLGTFQQFPREKFSDLSYVFDNSIQNKVNGPLGPNKSADPMTPLMRAYQNDNVQVRVLVGAHVFPHQFNLEGPTWFAEPSWKNSGYRSAQAMGLSEHFELLFHVPSSSAPNTDRKCPDGMSGKNCVDYFYSPSFDENGMANGLWGLFRSYDPTAVATQLKPLPNNPVGPATNVSYATCPGPVNRTFKI
ncbi:MAG TPA: hypothetical protein VN920_06315, partial [Pyrinomonadaceae bacterium]|nr:hypothetical protein [Pyrinomonadaceae bacterium]